MLRPLNLRWLRTLLAPLLVFSWLRTAPASEISAEMGLAESGSSFETRIATQVGSAEVIAESIGDFRSGQEVLLTGCRPVLTAVRALLDVGAPGAGKQLEVRGVESFALGSRSYLLEVIPGPVPAFRWSADQGRNWSAAAALNSGWSPLEGGLEIHFAARDWHLGAVLGFSVRDLLVTTIDRVSGNRITLAQAVPLSRPGAVLHHCADRALRTVVAAAVAEGSRVLIPNGHYRITGTIMIRGAGSILVEGQGAEGVLVDIGDGEGPCFTLDEGRDVTLRNLRMQGFMGFEGRDQAGLIQTRAGAVWGFGLRPCSAVRIQGTERVLVENCHARRMSAEAFSSYSPSRSLQKPDGETAVRTRSVTYLRCSVQDCARNAFNDQNCGPENTTVQQCRVEDVGGCAWEGASRFVRFIGNTVRHAGTVAMGNLGPENRDGSFERWPAGQHMIADNVFEGEVPYGGCAVRSTRGATQVVIRDNLFLNLAVPAIEIVGGSDRDNPPSGHTVVSGNLIDLTCPGRSGPERWGILVGAPDTVVSDNQIYVRGEADPNMTGIRLSDAAVAATIHDNQFRRCGIALATIPAEGRVASAPTPTSFLRTDAPADLPMDRSDPGRVKGWRLQWIDSGPGPQISILAGYDALTQRFTTTTPHGRKAGARFRILAPPGAVLFHHNLLSGCLRGLDLQGQGNASSLMRENLVSDEASAGAASLEAGSDAAGGYRTATPSQDEP